MNVEEAFSKESTSLIEYEKIPGTPFTAVKQNGTWFLTMGNYKITEGDETKEQALERLETDRWLIIMHLSIIVQEKTPQLQQEALKQKDTNAYGEEIYRKLPKSTL